MQNMKHCRFHNTLEALRECHNVMDDGDLSPAEQKARTALIRLCSVIASDYEDELATGLAP